MNTKFASVAALGALALAAFAPQAAAADNGFYLGAGITSSKFDVGNASDSLDDNSYKIIAGFRPLDWLALEGNYIDLGSESDGSGTSLDAQAFTVSGLFIAEFAVIDLYARLGMANWRLNAELNNLHASDDGWEPTYGVGIGAHFGSIGIRAEYESFQASDYDLDVNTVSLSVTYTFL
jgi:OOP family OmpA-OmpF porin